MLGVKRIPRPLSESRKPESRRKTSVCAGHAPATNRFTPRLPRTALRTAGEGGERSEPGEGSASPEFSASVVRPRRAGCLPSKGQRWAFALAKNVAGLRRVRQALGLATGLLSAAAAAQQPLEAPPLSLATVEVVGATPLLGCGLDRDKVPAETQVLTDRDLSRSGYPQMLPA